MTEVETRRRIGLSEPNEIAEDIHVRVPEKMLDPNLKKDRSSVLLLLLLYVLQGIPLGLAAAMPMILQNRKISYAEQALFSFVHWPFSVKLIWAPIVDSIYFSSVGRRKSWLVPIQYLIGLFMLIMSYSVKLFLGDDPDIYILTSVFILLNFLAATQDIAVDGWALTMLSKENVGFASTCNTVGQTAGYFIGNVVFLALESTEFCNKYLRSTPQDEGIVTLSGFLYFWGFIFIIITTLVMLLKRENVDSEDDEILSISETYKMLYKLFCLPSVRLFTLLLLTCKIGFSATDAVAGLKLIEAGVKKENLALLAIPMVPLQILLPIAISKYTCGPNPLDVFLKSFPYRLLFGPIFAIFVWWTWGMSYPDGTYPLYYYFIMIILYALHQVTVYSIYVSLMGFHAKISDPAIGGTYMTLLNTVTNLGGNWPATVALWLVDPLSAKYCSGGKLAEQNCVAKLAEQSCLDGGGTCVTTYDGFYLEIAICTFVGFAWLWTCKKYIRRIQRLPPSAWKAL